MALNAYIRKEEIVQIHCGKLEKEGQIKPKANKRKEIIWDFPRGAVVKNPPANAGNMGSTPGPGRSHMRRATKPVHHNY